MAKTIVHIGMPRTGSTFLQRSVFPLIPNFRFVDLQFAHYSGIFQKLQYQDDTLYNDTEAKVWAAGFTSENIIISNENFSGQSLHLAATNRTRNAKRLKSLFPEAEIILVLRNQVSLLQSLYAISIYGNVNLMPEKFLHFGDSAGHDQFSALYRTYDPVEHVENYLYTPMVALYKSLFKNVHLVLFEELMANQVEFLKKLETIFGEAMPPVSSPPANKSPGTVQLSGMRNLNKLAPMLQGPTGKKILRKAKYVLEHKISTGSKFEFTPELQKRLKQYFLQDNKQLTNLYLEEHDKNYLSYYI